jgi:single-stranded-DNA-specific exonuclease
MPAYVFAYSEEKGVWKGSGRSGGAVHLYDLTSAASDFAKFGGHAQAVGLSVKDEDFERFFLSVADAVDNVRMEVERPVEIVVDPSWIDLEFMKLRSLYAPFGEGRDEPLFVGNIDPSSVVSIRVVKGSHTFMELSGGVEAALFGEALSSPPSGEFFLEPGYSFNPYSGETRTRVILRRRVSNP